MFINFSLRQLRKASSSTLVSYSCPFTRWQQLAWGAELENPKAFVDTNREALPCFLSCLQCILIPSLLENQLYAIEAPPGFCITPRCFLLACSYSDRKVKLGGVLGKYSFPLGGHALILAGLYLFKNKNIILQACLLNSSVFSIKPIMMVLLKKCLSTKYINHFLSSIFATIEVICHRAPHS